MEPTVIDVEKVGPTVNTVSTKPTKAPVEFTLSLNPFGPSVEIDIPIKDAHPTLKLNLFVQTDNNTLTLKDMAPSTPHTGFTDGAQRCVTAF